MFDNIGWGEILVLVVAGLFILGPERLPEAAAWLGKAIRQVKGYASGARDQLRSEFGSEFDELRKPLDELRGLKNFNPRTAVQRSLFDDDVPQKPNGFAPPPGGTVPGSAAGATVIRPPAPERLAPDEKPPVDPDAT